MIPLFITGHGAVTALGLDAPRTIASLRAGMDAIVELPFAGVTEKDLRAVPIQGYAEGLTGPRRLEALAARALAECMGALRADEPQRPMVFLGLPSGARPNVDPALEGYMRETLERRMGLPRGSVRTFCHGRTSVLEALAHAESWLKNDAVACIVGGVDSLAGPGELRALSEQGLLAEEYDGFFPGEAAAFVCLSRRSTVGPLGRRAVAVVGAGEALEPADGSKDAPLIGVGMAAAVRAALANAELPPGRLGWYLNSVNGTRAEFEDDAMARIRFMRESPHTQLEVWHLASYLGETGAAYGALALLWASAALELGLESPSGVLISAVEGARRAAAVLQNSSRDIESDMRAPRAGFAEPALHTLAPIAPTAQVEGDPGIRLADIDDRHRTLAERNFDSLASLLMVRDTHLVSESPWIDIESFERRALAHLDALAWSGNTAREIARAHLSEEPEEAAAATLVLCCLPSRGDEVDVLVEACAETPKNRGRIAGAAALCPRGAAESFLLRLAEVDREGLRDALWALAIARWLTPEWIDQAAERLGGPIPEIAVALGTVEPHGPSAWPTSWLTGSGPLPLDAALAGMVLELPAAWLRRFKPADLIETMPEALGVGHLQMQGSVLATLGRDAAPTRGAVIALGWSGETEGAPLLLDALGAKDEVIAEEAARSLARMYGARPIETVVVTEDDDGDGVPPRKQDRLTRNRFQWEEALRALPGAAVGGAAPRRLRGGRPWSRESAREMLLDPKTPCSERAVAVWEDAIVRRASPAVHTRQWVGTQRRLLAARPVR